MVRVVLVHPGDFLLPELGEQLGRYASRKRSLQILKPTGIDGKLKYPILSLDCPLLFSVILRSPQFWLPLLF